MYNLNSKIECQYCKKKFKQETYLIKHQKNTKYCVIIQKQLVEKDIENSIQNLQNAKININREINDLVYDDDLIADASEDLLKKKNDEIHAVYLQFEKEKIIIDNEYNYNVSTLLNNGDIKNNLEQYYTFEKNKISKIQNIFSEFENKKLEIQN